jgi:hypothetical protein
MVAEPERPRAPRGWYGALLGGLVPLLVGGFVASAVADRLAFVGWALAAAAAYAAALYATWGARWPLRTKLTAMLGVLAVSLAAFGHLAAKYREDLLLGIEALMPVGDELP